MGGTSATSIVVLPIFLVEDHLGKRRWIDRQRVIQTWVTNFPLRLRERLHIRRFQVHDGDWWKTARPEEFGGYWGGQILVLEGRGHPLGLCG
jgi:hypothetical protein